MKRKTARKPKSSRAVRGARSKIARTAKVQRARHAPAKAEPADVIDTLVAANAQALGLVLEPDWHDGIKFYLALILRLAAIVDQFPLPDDSEPAPVFHA